MVREGLTLASVMGPGGPLRMPSPLRSRSCCAVGTINLAISRRKLMDVAAVDRGKSDAGERHAAEHADRPIEILDVEDEERDLDLGDPRAEVFASTWMNRRCSPSSLS